MKTHFKYLVVGLLVVSLSISNHSKCYAVAATEFTQIANHIELLLSVQKQTQMVINQVMMIENQLKSLAKYSNGHWGDTLTVLAQLDSVIEQGQALSFKFENLVSDFNQKFPGYVVPDNYSFGFKQSSTSALDSIRNALAAASAQKNYFASELNLLKTINAQSDHAEGETQAIQSGNQLLNQTATQIILLRKLMMDQMQSEVGYMAYQVNREATNQAVANSFFKEIPMEKGKNPAY